ncbi:recombinase family protein [Bacillus sp. REN3]|uniref:recombinase family protein n=1 Tax=Bacillus sp. REN3 TaxID=2802440 RepID=UPI001AEDFD91
MKFGYSRVSTKSQQLNGNSIEAQEQQLKAEGCEVIYTDAYTGIKCDRPEFQKLLSKLQAGDTLVVTRLDRLARNTREGIDVIELLFKESVRVHVLNVGLLEDTTMGRFFLQTLLAVSEMERSLILERTSEGKEIAKRHPDFREGRPNKYSKKQIAHALNLLETYSYSQVEDMTGISRSTLVRAKRKAISK